LDNELAILFIRGERPIMDKKYEITHHPNVSMTPDNGDKDLEYHHGEITEAIASVSLTYDIDDALDFDLSDAEFVFADE
jgi:type IV secretory pathway, VirD4 component